MGFDFLFLSLWIEDGMRFGIIRLEILFRFASPTTFHYRLLHEDRRWLDMVKFENKVFICHCSRLSLSL
ncbi:hypothetical protein B5F38_08125 [Barnesiella sp. An22]|nr:hypothetical protein B5F38_08125 [Barnesiella sp. An22]